MPRDAPSHASAPTSPRVRRRQTEASARPAPRPASAVARTRPRRCARPMRRSPPPAPARSPSAASVRRGRRPRRSSRARVHEASIRGLVASSCPIPVSERVRLSPTVLVCADSTAPCVRWCPVESARDLLSSPQLAHDPEPWGTRKDVCRPRRQALDRTRTRPAKGSRRGADTGDLAPRGDLFRTTRAANRGSRDSPSAPQDLPQVSVVRGSV